MQTTMITTATIVDETTTFTVQEICTRCNVTQDLLVEMMEYGLFDFNDNLDANYPIDLKTVKRIESAFHLHRDLEINMPGIAVILELKDELEQLHTELALLHRHLSK